LNNFNRLSWIYDPLARLVFQGNILKSQGYFLYLIEPHSRVLIIGGGSGLILEAMDKLNKPLMIDFIEPSELMIERARKRSTELSNLEVRFHQIRLQSFESNQKYDCICCFYFLDLFELVKLRKVLEQIKSLMGKQAHLFVADFQNRKGEMWQNLLSCVMHTFFRLTAGLESSHLKNIDHEIIKGGFKKQNESHFFLDFIFSAVYKK